MDFQQTLLEYQTRIKTVLASHLPPATCEPSRLHEALNYSVLLGGKRVRAILTYATGLAFGAHLEQLDIPACALEYIHAYSLVHDDLPAMDNDDLRRGQPTCHLAFDEGTSILVGDALQSLAFKIISEASNYSYQQKVELTASLARGAFYMAQGQALDLAATGNEVSLKQLKAIHANKTGALIESSIEMGAIASPHCSPQQRETLMKFAKAIGLAFQIKDDILDIESSTEVLGKTQGADESLDKATYPSLMGLKAAKQTLTEVSKEAFSYLNEIPNIRCDLLKQLSEYIIERKN